MIDAKDKLDPLGLDMAGFYFEYGDFILKRMEKNVDLFNAENMPKEKVGGK